MNIQKTQILSYNYSPPLEISKQYTLNWQANSIKYLGELQITITINLGLQIITLLIPKQKQTLLDGIQFLF